MENKTDQLETLVLESISASIEVKRALRDLVPEIARAARLLAAAYQRGGKCIFFGNGGSAADAQHMAGELECRFRFDRPPLAAVALHANTSSLTAVANDYGYEHLFSRLLQAHARPGDVAVAITTSGTSRNVLEAAKLKEKLGLKLIALTGQNGEALRPYADVLVAVPSASTPRIQEAHGLIGHILCEWVEREVFAGHANAEKTPRTVS